MAIFNTFLLLLCLLSWPAQSYGLADLRSPRHSMDYFLKEMKQYKKGKDQGLYKAMVALDLTKLSSQTRQKSGRIAAKNLINTLDRIERIDIKTIPLKTKSPWVYKIFDLEIDGQEQEVRIEIHQLKDGNWKFSPHTVQYINYILSSLRHLPPVKGVERRSGLIETVYSKLPPWAFSVALGASYIQWFFLLGVLIFSFILEKFFRLFIGRMATAVLRKRYNIGLNPKKEKAFTLPLGVFFFTFCASNLVGILELPELFLVFIYRASRVSMALSLVFGTYALIDILFLHLENLAKTSENKFDDILVPLLKKSAKFFTVAIGIVLTGEALELNMRGILTGLGIGGLAFALAAKDTLSNLFGSLTVLLDRPFRIGDWIVVNNNVEGTVEEVGLRSTRIRTFYNSLISVPNGQLTNIHIDNMGERAYKRYSKKLNIAYETPREKIDLFCEGIKAIIEEHPKTRKDYYHVYLNDLSAHSLDILLYVFWETVDWSEELQERQRLLLDILDLAKELKVEFAYPTQTLYLKQDEKITP